MWYSVTGYLPKDQRPKDDKYADDTSEYSLVKADSFEHARTRFLEKYPNFNTEMEIRERPDTEVIL